MTIDASKTYTATVATTAGTFVITLDAKNTPISVNNFVFLAQKGFYHCVIFHRVIPASSTRRVTHRHRTGGRLHHHRRAAKTASRSTPRVGRHGQHRLGQHGREPVVHRGWEQR